MSKEKRPPGRPRGSGNILDDPVLITLQVNRKTKERLLKLAEKKGTTLSNLIRELCEISVHGGQKRNK